MKKKAKRSAKKAAPKRAAPRKKPAKKAQRKAAPRRAPPKKKVAARSRAPKKRAKVIAARKSPPKPPRIRTATSYATKPTPRHREDSGDAFIRDPAEGPAHTKDDLAEEMAEDFVSSATSGEETALEERDDLVSEEAGGPFVTTSADREFAGGTDASNPRSAAREAFPTTRDPRR